MDRPRCPPPPVMQIRRPRNESDGNDVDFILFPYPSRPSFWRTASFMRTISGCSSRSTTISG